MYLIKKQISHSETLTIMRQMDEIRKPHPKQSAGWGSSQRGETNGERTGEKTDKGRKRSRAAYRQILEGLDVLKGERIRRLFLCSAQKPSDSGKKNTEDMAADVSNSYFQEIH